tara:strand:+ start:150 stop:272 length:123 start_codon:yes stop_codon:yes gene_type:complete
MMLYAADFLIFNHMTQQSHALFHLAEPVLQMAVYMPDPAA